MTQPLDPEQIPTIREYLARGLETDDRTLGDVYAERLLTEVDRLHGVLAALADPSQELAVLGAQGWRDERLRAGKLFGDKPIRPTGPLVGLIHIILRSALPPILARLNSGATLRGGA